MEHQHEHAPWRPTMDSAPEFNAFANPMDRALENPRPFEDPDADLEESVAAPSEPSVVPIEPERRLEMIAHAAYLRSERRGFTPGSEIDDWLAAEVEVDQLLQSK